MRLSGVTSVVPLTCSALADFVNFAGKSSHSHSAARRSLKDPRQESPDERGPTKQGWCVPHERNWQGLPNSQDIIRNPSYAPNVPGLFFVSTPVPTFLRVHRGEDQSPKVLPKPTASDQFWTAFSAATGWRVDRGHDESVNVYPAVEMDLMASDPADALPPVVRDHARELAEIAAKLTREIEHLSAVVRRQEVELAAHAAAEISLERVESTSDEIESTIQRSLNALGFDSAAIYMLDKDTQYLKTRVVVGLPVDRLQDEPRMLRGSRADLEAMVQDSVLIEDLAGPLKETWNAPEEAGAAICVSLLRGDLPIGTLWLFSNEPVELDDSAGSVARLTATQLTMQLSEAARIRREENSRASVQAVRDVASWQFSSLPLGNELAPGWFADGMIESPNDWAIGWHSWDVLPDGTLMLALAEAENEAADGAMIAATARAAMTAHGGYRHSPQQMMQRVSDTLWQTNTADQLVSLLYLRLNPETGEGQVASAGKINGLIGGKYGYRPLIGTGSPLLASAPDIDCIESTFNLAIGETILGFGTGLHRDGIGQELIGCCLRTAAQSSQRPLAILRREMAAFPNRSERGIVALTRGATS